MTDVEKIKKAATPYNEGDFHSVSKLPRETTFRACARIAGVEYTVTEYPFGEDSIDSTITIECQDGSRAWIYNPAEEAFRMVIVPLQD